MSPHTQFLAHFTAVDAAFKFSPALPSIYSSQKTSLQSKRNQNTTIVHRLHHRGFGGAIITYNNQYSCNCKISSASKKLVVKNNYSLDARWIALRDANWCKREVQKKVESLKVGEIWLWRCAAATLTAVVVQVMICQDISYAISSRTQFSLVDFRFTERQAPSDARVGFSSNVKKNLHSAGIGVTLTRPVLGAGGKQLTTIRMNKGLVTRRQEAAILMGLPHTTRSQDQACNFGGPRQKNLGPDLNVHKMVVLCLKVSGGTFSRGLAGGSREELMGIKAFSTSLPTLPLASVTSSLTSPLAYIIKAGSNLDFNVLRASLASSLNLISLCTFVVWMQRSGQLPAETPVVLSQVAFRVLIPCFLMTKVAVTLASHPSANLLFLPLFAIAQVLVGAVLGKLACRIVYREPASVLKVSTIPAKPVPAAITTSVGSGLIDQMAESPGLNPPLIGNNWNRSKQYTAAKKEAIITAACAFGNSFTLPLIFMTGVLAAEDASQVAGYLALFMVGWSPALWTVGYSLIATGDEQRDAREDLSKTRFSWRTLMDGFRRIMNPPLYGVLVGVLVGGTPLSHIFLPRAVGNVVSVESTGVLAAFSTATAGILRPVFDAASLLGSATLAVQTVVLATSLASSLPPLSATTGTKKSPKTDLQDGASIIGLGSNLPTLEPVLDNRAFWIISSIRLFAMPIVVIASTTMMQCSRILPVDPIFNLILLVEAAMPSAQNLVLLSQLRASTRPLSGVLADLLLRQYALSIVPITVWMAVFLALVKTA